MRLLQNSKEALQRVALKAEAIKVKFNAFLMEETDHDAFAIHGRDR